MISIIIPAYKEQLFLKRCITSLYKSLREVDLNHEVIVVVDEKYINQHKKKLNNFNKIKYVIINKKATPASSRNLGAKYAKFKWLLFLDSDCEINIEYFRNFIRYTKNCENADGFLGNIISSTYGAIPLLEDYDYQKSMEKYFYKKNNETYTKILSGANFIINKDIFLKEKGFNSNWKGAEDREFGARCYKKGYRMIYKKDLIAYHHYYPDLFHTIKRHIWHAKWNAYLYVEYPSIFRRPIMTRIRFTLSCLKRILVEIGYLFAVICVYNIIFLKQYSFWRIKNGKR